MHTTPGTDPEILHERWLYPQLTTLVQGGGWLIMVDVSYTTLHKRTRKGGWLATLSTPPPPPWISPWTPMIYKLVKNLTQKINIIACSSPEASSREAIE